MNEDRVFNWDDEIEDDGKGFVTLEEGNYEFKVTGLERANYTPSAKSTLPACNMAVITIEIVTPEGICTLKDNLHLCGKMEWKISSFYRAIGLKKHGEKLKMQWDKVIGCTGKAHVTKMEGTQKPGVFFNNVGYYIDPEVTTEGGDNTWS